MGLGLQVIVDSTETPCRTQRHITSGTPTGSPPGDSEPRRRVGVPVKSDLRNHQAIVQPRRLYDCLMVTQNRRRSLLKRKVPTPGLPSDRSPRRLIRQRRRNARLARSCFISTDDDCSHASHSDRSGQVRFITRPKSRTMRATRQLMLPPSTVS